VVVRYAEWLGRTGANGERRLYVYPMAAEGAEGSLPVIEELTATFDLGTAGAKEVRVGMAGVREGSTVVVREHDFVPRADLALELFDLGEAAPGGYSAPHTIDYETLAPADREDARKRAREEADYVLVALRPEHIPLPKGGLDLAIVIDTSAATDAASLAIARAAAGALLAHLGPEDRVAVWAGDAALRPVVEPAGQAGPQAGVNASPLRPVDEASRRAILQSLATVERGGATDLGAMLTQAAATLDPARRGAVVYIGDGSPTVGELALPDLRERLARLPRPVRIFSLGVGEGANMALLKGLSKGALSERIGDGNEAARAALRLLETAERPALLGASVDLGPSVERVYPRDLSAIVADESVFVIGRASAVAMPTSVVVSGAGGQTSRLPLKVFPVNDLGDLTRRWAEGRLAQTMDDGEGRAAMVDLGVRHGIITPVTSLYVQTTKEMTPEEREELKRAQRAAALRRPVSDPWSPYKADKGGDDLDEEEKETEQVAENNADNKEGGTGTRAKGEEGSMGNPNSKVSGNRYGVQGPPDNADPHIARQQALRDSAEFGMIGLLNSGAGGDPNAPTSPWGSTAATASAAPAASATAAPWGRDDSLGNDPASARGNMWGAEPVTVMTTPPEPNKELTPTPPSEPDLSDAYGGAGLGLSGIGNGGGGTGLGSIGTIGHGAGTGTGQGFGSGAGRLGGAHRSSPPTVRMGATTVTGRLPPEVIQRIVRQNFGRFRLCYEAGLKNNPNLQGRVAVRFVIGADGAVSNVGNAGSDMPDGTVVSCVVRAFYGFAFPQPEGGIVSVVYPIMFSPGGGSVEPKISETQPSGGDAKAKTAAKPGDAAKADGAASAKAGEPEKGSITIRIGDIGHTAKLCGAAAFVPFEERIILWRERLSRYSRFPESAATVYRNALQSCEAPTWRERSKLLSLMLDMIPDVAGRVALWRAMLGDTGAADALYRGMLARVRTTQQARELHAALGLKSIDPGFLEKTLAQAKTPQDRVAKLRAFTAEWPNDFQLALRLLDALEDAGDAPGARALGRSLRARPDADARVRTAVGELYLRLAAREGDAAQKALDEAEARRAFGEIVEFAPDDPVARRRLGDLLRAHGWYAEAARHYETLAALAPDDASVSLLLAAAAEGLGKLEEALRWTEKGGSAGAPDVEQSPAYTARAFAATYLAWGRLAAAEAGRADEQSALSARLARVISGDRGASRRGTRVTLTWAHPELHPALWSNALGAPMPAREGDVTLGIAQVIVPERDGAFVEVRLEPDEVEHAARLGATAVLTAMFDEGESGGGKVIRAPVIFARGGPAALRFAIGGGEIRPVSK
jgi:tetratricopeptide (TPR) repeat protein